MPKIHLLNEAMSALFPQRCIFCGRVTLADTQCCIQCEAHLRREDTAAAFTLADCTVYSCFYYTRQAVQRLADLKFYGKRELAEYFSAQMTSLLQERLEGHALDQITYVPMPPLREQGRGYNQAKLLAQGVAKGLGLPLLDCGLQKTEPLAQHDLHLSMRRKQADAGVTMVEGTTLCGSVLLVDDLCTSGQTLAACIRLLRQAGAAQITAVTAFRQG